MKLNKLLLALAASGIATSAFATNGYFSHGYGTKSKAMGGASIALGQDALAAASNPANMVLVGSRVDIGAELFNPVRQATVNATVYESGKDVFVVPEFGYNKLISPNMSVGVSVFGNGGMNTEYASIPTYNGGGTSSKSGIDLAQLFIAPTVSWKLDENNSVGVSLNLAYQRFKAYGISSFDSSNFTLYVGSVTDRGYDDSTGVGARIGWTGKLSDEVTFGATYQTKTNMTKFDKYKGLFAEAGDFDIPSNYGLGLSVMANPKTTVAIDYVRINYTDSKAVSNPISQLLSLGVKLGADNGAGFGWKDQDVVKLGVSYEYDQSLTIRAGLNHGSNVIPTSQLSFNVLAPATVENHITLGFTKKLSKDEELSGYLMHAFNKSIDDVNNADGFEADGFKMHQYSVGIGYSWKM